jgi:hypothetical protein
MAEFSGIDANVALVNFLISHGSELPDHIRGPIQDEVAGNDGLAALIAGVEGLYAYRAELNEEGRALLLDLIRFVTARGFYGYNRGAGRGLDLLVVVERLAAGGEAVIERKVEDGEVVEEGDPDPERRFVPKTEGPQSVEPPIPPGEPQG